MIALGRLATAAIALAAAVGCGADDAGRDVAGVTVADGFSVTTWAEDLDGPTQVDITDDGTVLVALLDGPEGSTDGEVVALPADGDGAPTVVFDGLDTPTGVTAVGDEVWVMERRRLSRGPVDGGRLTVVADELPFNGRSEGTLTATADDTVLYDTSGAIDGDGAAQGSGVLWEVGADDEPVPYATGFKHAYARVFDDEGVLWEVEVDDGLYDGEPSPDEVMAVERGSDHGWPRCVGDARPVALFGGDADSCGDVPRAHTDLGVGATPTSIVQAPWDPDVLLVALWSTGRVVAIDRDRPGAEPTTFLGGVEHPQHLVVQGDRVLLSDHDGDRILAISPAGR